MINGIIFQCLWFYFAYFGNDSNYVPIHGAILTAFLCFHFLFQIPKHDRWQEFQLMLFSSVLGIFMDLLCHYLKIITLKEFFYFWLIPIWILFAGTLNHSLSFFTNRPKLCAFMFSIFGPMSYYGASQFGLFNYQSQSVKLMIVHGVLWGVYSICITQFKERYHEKKNS